MQYKHRYYSYLDFEFVNAQPMNLRLLNGTFSQQTRGYTEHLTDLLAPGAGKYTIFNIG